MNVIKKGPEGYSAPAYEAHCYGCGAIVGFRADEAKQVLSLLQPAQLAVICPQCKCPISVTIAHSG